MKKTVRYLGDTMYKKLFPECANNGLRPFECPGVIFSLIGLVNIVMMIVTYLAGRNIANEEVIVLVIITMTAIMLLIAYNVSSDLQRIAIARRDLEEEQRKVVTIVEQLTDGLLFLDPECRIRMVNRQAEVLLGITEERVVGMPRGVNMYEEFPALKEILRWCPTVEELQKQREFEPIDVVIERPAKRTLRVTTAGVTTRSGQVLGFIKVLHDASKEKELDELKSEFLSVTSHQLRTPLSSLRWFIELFVNGRLGELPPEQLEIMKKMEEMNIRMINLVEDLLGATRIEQGQMEFSLHTCSIDAIVSEMVQELEIQAKAKNLELKVDIQGSLPTIECDPDKIRVVVQNLIENALRYTPKGSVTVRVREEQGYVFVEVQDTGIGLTEAERKNIFAKFYRGDRARELEPEGTGLGLYLIQNIVQKHHGTLSVESEKGKGSIFKIALPTTLEHSSTGH